MFRFSGCRVPSGIGSANTEDINAKCLFALPDLGVSLAYMLGDGRYPGVLMRGNGNGLTTVRIEMVVLRSISAARTRGAAEVGRSLAKISCRHTNLMVRQNLGSGPNFGNPKNQQAASAPQDAV